jgi:hypothetical protein
MTISDIGVTGTPVVAFRGVTDETVTAPTPLPFGSIGNPIPAVDQTGVALGYFTIAALSSHSSTTYNDTPFSLTFRVNAVNSDPAEANPNAFTVQGYLNGTVSGSQPSTLQAFIVSPVSQSWNAPYSSLGDFRAGPLENVLTSAGGLVSLPLPSPPSMAIPEVAVNLITTMAVPEPASVVLFTLLGLGLIFHRRRSDGPERGLVAQAEDGEVEGIAGR